MVLNMFSKLKGFVCLHTTLRCARPAAPAPDGHTITKRETRIQKERDVDLREVSGFQLKGRLIDYFEVHREAELRKKLR